MTYKRNTFTKLILILTILLSLSACSPATQTNVADSTVAQFSTFTALNSGIYTGEISIEELGQYGGFGLGTFDDIEGEMVVLDGTFYQAKIDGTVEVASQDMTSPFANVHFFQQDETLTLDQPVESLDDFKSQLDQVIPHPNTPYAFRIDGTFSYLLLRSVPKQEKPYPELSEVIAQQQTFEHNNLSGTIVGYYFPQYVNPVGIPGYHFHFISDDEKKGGHVLDCQFDNIEIALDDIEQINLIIPENSDFQNTDFESENMAEE